MELLVENPVTQTLHGIVSGYGIPAEPWHVGLFVALVAVWFLFALALRILRLARGTSRGNTILLLGHCNAGKTALYYRLRSDTYVESVTSMVENQAVFPIAGSTSSRLVKVVDFPGHNRLREGLAAHVPNAAGVVFVVDAVHLQDEVKSVAQYLYDLWTDPVIHKKNTPFLIALNKSDFSSALAPAAAQARIEQEIELLRQTRANAPSQEGGQREEIFLGIEGEKFKLDHLSLPVQFAKISCLENHLDDVKHFIKASL